MWRWGGANTPNRFWSYTTVRQLLQIQNPLWAVADKCSWNSKHCWGWQLGAEGASLILRKEHGAIWWLHLRKYTWWILIVSLWLPAAFYASSASWLSKDRAFIHSLYKSLDSCIEICACQKQNTHTDTYPGNKNTFKFHISTQTWGNALSLSIRLLSLLMRLQCLPFTWQNCSLALSCPAQERTQISWLIKLEYYEIRILLI